MSSLFACFIGNRRNPEERTQTQSNNNGVSSSGNRAANKVVVPSHNTEIVYVELLKDQDEPLGLRLEGGIDQDRPAVRVSHLYPGGVAYLSNALQIGDRVLSINGTVTDKLTQSDISALLDNAGCTVNLEIAFITTGTKEGVQKLDDGMELRATSIRIPYQEHVFPGFVISGGSIENRPITVSHVRQGSYPYRKGILRAGDRILQINGIDMRAASRSDAEQLLVPSETDCILQIEYDASVHEGLEETSGPLIVELQKPHGASLGITLSNDRVAGEPMIISHVREAGIADRSGVLHAGDRLLSVNSQELTNKTLHEVHHILAHSRTNVKLEIMPAHQYSDRLGASPLDDGMSDNSSRTLPSATGQRRPSQLSLSSLSPSNPIQSHPEVMEVVIVADPIGYGMGIQGGASEYSAYPIIISDIAPNGPAGLLGQLSVGDRILSINGVNVCNVSLDHASKLIHEAEDHLQLEIEFDVTESSVVPTSGTFDVNLIKCGFLKLGISIRRSGDRIWIGSLLKGGVAHRSGSLLAGDILLAINGISLVNEREAIALLSAPCDVISLNVKRESVNNFLPSRPSPPKSEPVIYSVELTKNGQSLGISLNGSNVPGQPIVIAGIREGGVAHRTGAIKVNDRIIAINGESLLTKTIQDAQRILQTAGNTVTLKISKGVISRRRKNHQLTRGGATNTRHYRSNKHMPGGRQRYIPRAPSRMSQTSESEMSEFRMSLEDLQEPKYMVNGRGGSRYTPTSHAYAPPMGRYSPSNRQRLNPPKEMMTSRGGVPIADHMTGYNDILLHEDEEEEEERLSPRSASIRKRPVHGARSPMFIDQSHLLRGTNRLPKKPPDKRIPEASRILSSSESKKDLADNLVQTLLKSKDFVTKLKTLAAHSGSSTEDSDQETAAIPSHVHKELMNHVHSLMAPMKMTLIDAVIERDGGFGFSVSDGLIEGGVYINQIQPDGPADKSGIQPFDKIVKVNGVNVKDYDCCKIKPLFTQTDKISMTVVRNPLALGDHQVATPTSQSNDVISSSQPIEEDDDPSRFIS